MKQRKGWNIPCGSLGLSFPYWMEYLREILQGDLVRLPTAEPLKDS